MEGHTPMDHGQSGAGKPGNVSETFALPTPSLLQHARAYPLMCAQCMWTHM